MKKIEPLKSMPRAFDKLGKKINELVSRTKLLKAGKGVKISESEDDIMISLAAGGGLPDGYGPEEFTICDSGSPVARKFITDNPD